MRAFKNRKKKRKEKHFVIPAIKWLEFKQAYSNDRSKRRSPFTLEGGNYYERTFLEEFVYKLL